MSEESYTLIRDIESGDIVRLDFRWIMNKNKITDFTINVCLIEGENIVEVYRIDTKHGYAHEHRFWKQQEPKKLDINYNKLFIEKKVEVLENYH
ncbi:MAG TPA: hypothetical protein VL944_00605 [Candidatus Acidoferrum sp.]|nr:hypothetical protein [Candidatus Acidoferrum sp.]